jgi:hypothetical protein
MCIKSPKIKDKTNLRYKNDYMTTIENLAHSVKISTENNLMNNTCGFKSTNVPRVQSIIEQKTPSNKFKLYTDRILKSVDSVKNQNEKFKIILKEKVNLEKIKDIANQKEILNKNLPSTGKFMGEKYNPHNFIYNFQKSSVRRNKYGALFQH